MMNMNFEPQAGGNDTKTSHPHRTLTLRNGNHIERSYAVVVISDDRKRAIKLFHRGQEEQQAIRTFKSEVSAYHIASEDHDLKRYIPDFYGAITIDQVLDQHCLDISSKYYCQLAYEMSFISGNFSDINAAFLSQHGELANLFRHAGIKYLSDVSVTYDEYGNLNKIVDFATEHHEPCW